MSSKLLYKCNVVLYELKKPRYTIIHIWNCYSSPILKAKIYTNSKFLCRYEITALMLIIPKQILTNV